MSGRGFLFTLLISVQTLIIIRRRGKREKREEKLIQDKQFNRMEVRAEKKQINLSTPSFFFFSSSLFPFRSFVIPRKSFLSIIFPKIEKERKREVTERKRKVKEREIPI